MTAAERKRLGAKLRALRAERRLHQTTAAHDAGLSTGTLQAIESGASSVRLANLKKLAVFFGFKFEELRADVAPDPRTELNDEHLAVAFAYRNARNRIREIIELLLLRDDAVHRERVAKVMLCAAYDQPPHTTIINALLDTNCAALLLVMARAYERFLVDPSVVLYLDEHLTSEERRRVPQPKQQPKRSHKAHVSA